MATRDEPQVLPEIFGREREQERLRELLDAAYDGHGRLVLISGEAGIGSPDDGAGELPKAFVVKADEISEEEIIAYVAERVAPFKKIRLVEFADEIPKTASGKILRRDLIERERRLAAV